MKLFANLYIIYFFLFEITGGFKLKSSLRIYKNTPDTILINLASAILSIFVIPSAYASETLTPSRSTTFQVFVQNLDHGDISKVVFEGINPTYLTAYYKTGEVSVVKDGFPYYNDPLSPSGPAQAIAKVQHTPGVICQQDISDVLMKSKTRKSKDVPIIKPMLQHSAYPKSF